MKKTMDGLGIPLGSGNLSLGCISLVIALVFVYRSFYKMRVDSKK